MAEFKVGQKVRFTSECAGEIGQVLTIKSIESGVYRFEENDGSCSITGHFEILEGANMYSKGQIFTHTARGQEFMVLAVAGDLVALSKTGNFELLERWYTTKEMENLQEECDWKLKEEPETTELSIDEIAKKFKLKPEQIRIKKQD